MDREPQNNYRTRRGHDCSTRVETPSDSANGSRGSIYFNFPEIPGHEADTFIIRSGPYQGDDAGRYVIRQVTTYRSASLVALARFEFALAAGLPMA